MPNPVPATDTLIARDDPPRMSPSPKAPPRFALLSARPALLAITTVTDELGRPLAGMFTPDRSLL